MSTWITIKVEDLHAYLVAAQVKILQKCALAKDQSDPVLEIIRNTSLKIRAQVASNKKNSLSERPYAIPPELKNEACILILETAQTRIPGLKLTSDQIRLADQARLQLQKVVTGEFWVSIPDDRLGKPQKYISVVNRRQKIATGRYLKGL